MIKSPPSDDISTEKKNVNFHLGSDVVGPSEMDIDDSDGRRTMYKAGPKNGTRDRGRSQEPLSNLG